MQVFGITPASLLVKAIFVTAIIMQVILWPSAASIVFTGVYALGELQNLVWMKGGRVKALCTPGVFIFRLRPGSVTGYIFMWIMAIYFAIYFGLFISHELVNQPFATMWLHPSILAGSSGYLQSQNGNPTLPFDVTSDQSKEMRSNQFKWEKHMDGIAPMLMGSVPGAGAAGGAMECTNTWVNASGGGPRPFQCAVKLLKPMPPDNGGASIEYAAHPFVPLVDEFYTTDVLVTPPPNTHCEDLEVYRLAVDKERNVVSGLDYPSSVTATGESRGTVFAPFCGVFGNPQWCLTISHTFTDAEYRAGLAKRCIENNGKQLYRLPSRAKDFQWESGHIQLDVLLVSAGATVQLHAGWREDDDKNHNKNNGDMSESFISPWKQITHSDSAQQWRESSNDVDVFFKFMASVTPLLIVWYYLSTEFVNFLPGPTTTTTAAATTAGRSFSEMGQILYLCIFIMLPAVLIFLSIGAWLPMAGCIVCVLAVNHEVKNQRRYMDFIRPWLLFITAACNSVQFAWLIALIVQAGYNAFYYQLTLEQLYSLSYRFVISGSGSPTWIALIMPVVLVLNAIFLMASAISVVLETLAFYRKPSSAAARGGLDFYGGSSSNTNA